MKRILVVLAAVLAAAGIAYALEPASPHRVLSLTVETAERDGQPIPLSGHVELPWGDGRDFRSLDVLNGGGMYLRLESIP